MICFMLESVYDLILQQCTNLQQESGSDIEKKKMDIATAQVEIDTVKKVE